MSIALDTPPSWPWRGVSIENIDFSVKKLHDVIRTIPINSVQLRLKPRKLSEVQGISPDTAWEKSLNWADAMLDECKKTKLVSILTVEGFPIDPQSGYDQTSPQFWFSSQNRDNVIEIASSIATHFSHRGPELVAYQLLSEPVLIIGGKSFSPPQWKKFQADIIETIRKKDPNRWIAVAAAPWGLPSSYKNYELLPFHNIVYGAHMYEPHVYTHQGIRKYKEKYTYPGNIKGKMWDRKRLILSLSSLKSFQLEYGVPVWIGEFSAIRWAPGAEQYVYDLISIFDAYGWAWTYFSLNGWHGWNPDYNHHQPVKEEWKQQYVGKKSKRWRTLKNAFGAP